MNKILTGISEANSHLLEKKEVDDALNACIFSLGNSINIDRCYIFRNYMENGVLKLYYEYEWCNEGIEPYLGSPELSGYDYDAFPGLIDVLIEDKPFYGLVKDNPNKFFRDIMEMQGIKAYLFTPIFCEDFFWGWIGFDDCQQERNWKIEEVNALHSVARNIGLRLQNEKTLTELKDALFEMDFYIKSSNQAKWEWNIETGEVFFSYNWYGMLGYLKNEIPESYETWRKLVHPDEANAIEKNLVDYIQGKTNFYDGVTRLKHKNGHYVWVKYSGLLYRDENMKAKKIIGTHIDISEIKEKEAELALQRNEYDHLVNNLSEIIFKTDLHCNITFLNSQWQHSTGYLAQECIGNNIIDFIHQDDISKFNTFFKSDFNKLYSTEVRLKKRNNQYVWSLLILSKQKDFQDRADLIIGSITNIDDKIFFKNQLELSEEKFRFIAENTTDLICQHNIEGIFTYVSKSSFDILGYSDLELTGKNPFDFMHPNDVDQIIDKTTDFLQNGHSGSMEYRVINKNQKYIWIETIIKPLFNNQKEVIGFQSSSRNISERIKTQEEMKLALIKERELNELKSGFVSMASHQFRTPLTVIYSNVELLEFKYGQILQKSNDQIHNITGRIKNEVDRMTELMNNILIFGKHGGGDFSLVIKKLSIQDLIGNVTENYFNFRKDQKKIKTSIIGTPRDIQTDETLMIHIFTNIIGNAVKYSEKSKNPPQIEIVFEKSFFKISVTDFGIGIPKDEMQNIFKSFYRASNTSTFIGSGLGLVISKQFIELLKGTIHIESKENIQTTVTIEMPYEQE
jgi:PAS domain S-box-containing protein